MKDLKSNINDRNELLTPPEIIKALGPFDLDPCAPINRPWDTAARHYTIEDDGLLNTWEGRVWLNPPGSDTYLWLHHLATSRNGVALIPARTEHLGFHQEVLCKANAVFFFQGKLHFYHRDGRRGSLSNTASCLVSYSHADTESIFLAQQSGSIKGYLVRIR